MRKEIENIYDNLTNLGEEYEDFSETSVGISEFWKYFNQHIVTDEQTKANIVGLLSDSCILTEKQGFIHGFEYAVRLLTCRKEVSI